MENMIDAENLKHIDGFESSDDLLLLPESPMDIHEKVGEYIALLPGCEMAISRVSSTPIIISRGEKRPPMELISHPLMWLGERQRTRLIDDDGQPENNDHFVLRVTSELLASNTYTPGVGWLDCLSLMGLDPIRDYDRIIAWIEGGSDELLDTFTLDAILNHDDEAAASFDAATQDLPSLLEISAGIMAESLARTVSEVLEAPDDDGQGHVWTLEDRRTTCKFLSELAYIFLGQRDGLMNSYTEQIDLQEDPRIAGSFARDFLADLQDLAAKYGQIESDLLDGYEPENPEEFERAASATE